MQYVEYDHNNDQCARKLFFNSISKDLLVELCLRINDSDSFPVVWMIFIGIVMPCGVTRFESLKEKIQSRSISQYPGENITLLVKDYLQDAQELDKDGQYDHNLMPF